ncbi:programmed cell death protein 5 [Atheta coriaria]|uniref:programmed cell death protein 5 n=1 Tax=Dalotia coriaria TaxID=877792 RepID=UPI0031F3741F
MDDPDLEAIRKQRLAQLQAGYQGGDAQSAESKEKQAQAQQDAKNSILSQILDQSARARLNTLSLGKPEKGRMVEDMLVRMAQSGQIRNKISESDFIGILESVNAQLPQHNTSVKFDRRRAALDSDDDDF